MKEKNDTRTVPPNGSFYHACKQHLARTDKQFRWPLGIYHLPIKTHYANTPPNLTPLVSPSLTISRAQEAHTLLHPTGWSRPWLAPQYSRLLVKSPRSTPSRNRARTVEMRFLSRGVSANWNGMGLAMSRIE
jgi:hypothetical protein